MTDRRPSARVYDTVRTAHLERFPQMAPAQVFFLGTRYDYDESVAADSTVLHRVSRLGAVTQLARTPYRVVEVNEPFVTTRWLDLLAQIVAVRLRARLSGRPQRIVTYCIGNADPALELSRRWRLPLPVARVVSRVVVRLLVRAIDRLAFGTTGALDMYVTYAGRALLDHKARLFEALPAPCACLGSAAQSAEGGLVFLGAFDDHKGIRQVLAAWDEVLVRRPESRLRLLGKGRLVDEVTQWAATRAEVSVEVDPPRARIHSVLRGANTLILPSQRRGPWREQIGLPILEGLAHGCEIVTTTETGLADWLAANAHAVVSPDAPASELAEAVLGALDSGRSRTDVLADLPTTDRRIDADDWLMGAGPTA